MNAGGGGYRGRGSLGLSCHVRCYGGNAVLRPRNISRANIHFLNFALQCTCKNIEAKNSQICLRCPPSKYIFFDDLGCKVEIVRKGRQSYDGCVSGKNAME